MSLFNDMLSNEQTLFKDESVLDFDYIPPSIKNREEEINIIVNDIKPLFLEKRPNNLFITGTPGIGKTLTVRYVLNDLKQTSSEVVPCYINNWKCSTYHSVFVELSKFFGVPFPRKGVSTDEIIRSISKKLETKKGIVVVFDEIDKARDMDFIYPLIEGFGKKICIILISNDSNFLKRMDSRLLSRMNIENLHFKQYSYDKINNILSERVDFAFFPKVFKENAFEKIANYSFDNKDLRIGISLLLKSGRIAENDASKTITLEHVDKSLSNIKSTLFNERAKELESHEKSILDIIKQNNGLITGKIYEKFLEKNKDVSIRTFRKYLNRLETLEFIDAKETGTGFRGKSRRLYLR